MEKSKTKRSTAEVLRKNNPFNELSKKPNHLNAAETKEQMQNSESEIRAKNLRRRVGKKIH
jgi:hypothetical protein